MSLWEQGMRRALVLTVVASAVALATTGRAGFTAGAPCALEAVTYE